MWWFLEKIKDNDEIIEYSYGCLSEETSGVIKYDKLTGASSYVKLADGDTKKGVSVLLGHMWRLVNKENAPGKRKISIG